MHKLTFEELEAREKYMKQKTIKVVINVAFGLFSLSEQLQKALGNKYGEYGRLLDSDGPDIPRTDPTLVKYVEEHGAETDPELRVVEIPADVKWHIEEDDGNEHVAEDHRVWR